jgi:hypothetical protein
MKIEKEFIKIVNDSPEIFHNYSMLNTSYQTMVVNAVKYGAEIERERILALMRIWDKKDVKGAFIDLKQLEKLIEP